VLYDLSFLNSGAEWPPPPEKARLKRYEEGRFLFEGLHDKVYGNWWRTLRQDLKASLEIVYNFPRRLSNLWADLLIGEPPTYGPPEGQDSGPVEDLVRKARLNNVIREVVIDMSRFGDGLFKVRLKDGESHVEAVSPELWFPVVRRGDVRDITHHVIAWTFEQERGGLGGILSDKQKYLVCEIHARDAIEHRVMRLGDDGKIGQEVDGSEFFEDWEPRQNNPAGAPLVVHVPNQRTSNRLFGYDDYADLDGPLQEYEVRISQWSRINDRHADPPMAGPRLSPPEAGTEDASRVASGEKYFEVETDADGRASVPQYITWDQNVQSITAELDRLETMLYTASETSPAAFGQIRAGASESGTALKLQMKSERSKAARLRTDLDPAVKETIRLATALAGKEVEVEIAWKDGLPDDEREQTQIEAQKRQAGLTSLLSSIMRLEDLDEDAALEEMRRIREEMADAGVDGTANGSLQRSRALLEGLTGGRAEN
jgi:hypothetical protein